MSVSNALKNIANAVGEGPHWDQETETLYMADVSVETPGAFNGSIIRWKPSTGDLQKKYFDQGCPTIAIPTSDPNKCVTTQYKKLVKYDWSTEEVEILDDQIEQGLETRFNDGKCDPQGRLFIGTMSNEKEPAVVLAEEAGSLYVFDGTKKNARLETMDTKITLSNGMAWTADTRHMFFIDSFPRKVYLYDYDIDAIKLSNRKVALDFSAFPIEDVGYPDGCTMDANGNLWVACFAAGKVICFDVTTGQRIREVKFPAKLTTSCCFGGEQLDELFVTSSCFSVPPEEMVGSQSSAGSLFKVTGLGVKGVPMNRFKC